MSDNQKLYDLGAKLWIRHVILEELQEFAGSKMDPTEALDRINKALFTRIKPLAAETFRELMNELLQEIDKDKQTEVS